MKKVLIITYYWPPSGAIGVHRCLKFAKYLGKYGWTPVIYTAKDAQYPYRDTSNEKHIPPGITILKHPIREPFKLFKFFSGRRKQAVLTNPLQVRDKKMKAMDRLGIWIRGNFFIPDARSLWIKPSVKYLSKYLKDNPVDAILSDGPPHTNTVIACRLAQKFGIPWLADFQDPWTQVDYYKDFMLSRYADRKHRRMEQEAFRTARKITIASPSWKYNLEQIGAKNVDVIYWGYDGDDFEGLTLHSPKKDFVISHAGLLGHDRLPRAFFSVLRELLEEDPSLSERLKIKLAGSVDYIVKQCIEEDGLSTYTEYLGNIKRDEALRLTAHSSLLLLPLNRADNAKGRIPGKLFEQMRSATPILAFGPLDSDVAKILKQTGTGELFAYEDKQGLKQTLWHHLQEKQEKEVSSRILPYSVERQVAQLAEYLHQITCDDNR